MSAPTPLTDLDLLRIRCEEAQAVVVRVEHAIDRLSAENAALKSCLAAEQETATALRGYVPVLEKQLREASTFAPKLLGTAERLLTLFDEVRDNTEGRYPSLNPGCIECTSGAVPNRFNRGLCPEHAMRALLSGDCGLTNQLQASDTLEKIKRLLSVEAPRQNYKPRLQVLAPLGATGNDEEKGAAK